MTLAPFPPGIVPDRSSDWGLFALMNAANNYSQNPIIFSSNSSATTYGANSVIKNGLILRFGAPVGAVTDQLPSAILLVQAMQGPGNIPLDGTYSEPLRIINQTGQTITITTNTGLTLLGTMTIVNGNYRDFFLTPTSATTITVQNVGGGPNDSSANFTDLNLSGNLNFTSTGERITGDLSNATITNRLMVQTSTVNGGTILGLIPNGTGTFSSLNLYSDSAPLNSSRLTLLNLNTVVQVRSDADGAGTVLPLTFNTPTEVMRIDTTGTFVYIGTTVGVQAPSAGQAFLALQGAAGRGIVELSATLADSDGAFVGSIAFADKNSIAADKRVANIITAVSGATATNRGGALEFYTKANGASGLIEAVRITPAQNVLIGSGLESAGAERLQVTGSLSISSTTLIRTYTAFTNNAAAAVGTLLNAPTAGNPTKWIPINDNGTIRNIPAW